MHGPLSEIGLIEVLQLLERGRRSGRLRVTAPDGDHVVQLQVSAGTIVALEPDAGDHAIHAALAARFLVDPAASDRALTDDAASRRIRNDLAERALAGMIEWTGGRFDFEEGPARDGPLDIAIDALVFRLVDAETRRLELAPQLHQFAAVVDFAPADRIAAGAAHDLSPDDWRLLDLVDGRRDIAALATALAEPIEVVASSVRALESAAILELRPPAANDATEGARTALGTGRFDDAVRLFREHVAEHPDDAAAWRSLGLAEVGAGRFDRAIAAWSRWQVEDPAGAGDAAALILAAETMMEALRDQRD